MEFQRVVKYLHMHHLEVAAIALPILLLVIINTMVVVPLESLPSPIYGGDYYHQLGYVAHALRGGNPFESSMYPDIIPHYMVTYTILAWLIGAPLGLDALTSVLTLSFLIPVAGFILSYLFVRRLFGKAWIAAPAALMHVLIQNPLPNVKYTQFTGTVMVPLFLYTLLLFHERRTLWRAIGLGVIFGVLGLSHTITFIGSSLLLAAYAVWWLWRERRSSWGDLGQHLAIIMIPILLGSLIAMLWWFGPIFVYHGHAANAFSEWANPFNNPEYAMKFIWEVFRGIFFSFTSLQGALWSVGTILGVLALALVKPSEQIRFLRFAAIAGFIIIFHYLITHTMFGFSFRPDYMNGTILRSIFIPVWALGLLAIIGQIRPRLAKAQKGYLPYVAFGLLFILLSAAAAAKVEAKFENRWYANGRNAMPGQYLGVRDYLDENGIGVDAVVMTTKEVGFAFNAVTGRKLHLGRWSHSTPFLDLQERELAQAIILYGDDDAAREELLREWDIDYLYWDAYWIQSEWRIEGDRATPFDPQLLLYTPEREALLAAHNITAVRTEGYVDPGHRGYPWPTHDVLMIGPQNYHNFTNPWNPDLNSHLERVWSYGSGASAAALYKVVLD